MPDDEVEAHPDEDVEVPDDADRAEGADTGAGAAAVDAIADGPVAPLARDDLATAGPGARRVRLVLIVVAVLVAGLLVGRLTASGDDEGEDAVAGSGTTPEGGVEFPVGDVNRTGYWGFVNLRPIVIDTFDRPDDPDSLGDAGEGGTWEPVAGTWGVRDDAATTSGGSGDGPFLAVVPDGNGDGLTEVTMSVVEQGAGLVFRFLDASNYWSVTAEPGIGSWSVNRVIDGEAELVGEMPGPTADNTTVSVEQKGSILRFLLDGQEYLALTDGALADQLQGGLIASGSTTGEARWNRFLVLAYAEDASATPTTAPA